MDGSVQRRAQGAFGFFEFAPSERLDLDLVSRMIVAARDEVDSVDGVLLPESAVDESDVEDLEASWTRHGWPCLSRVCGSDHRQPGRLPGNWVHIGVSPRLEKVWSLPGSTANRGFTFAQNNTIGGRAKDRSSSTTGREPFTPHILQVSG